MCDMMKLIRVNYEFRIIRYLEIKILPYMCDQDVMK